MCYHAALTADLRRLEYLHGKPMVIDDIPQYRSFFHISGFVKPYLPVISNQDPQSLRMYRWGLVPSWVKDEATFRANTLNATMEKLFEASSYRNSWRNRCLVIVTAFFEPHLNKESGRKESWVVKPRGEETFTLGAIWNIWKGVPTFSIVTTSASPLMAQVHNEKMRMPLILSGERAEAWVLNDLSKNEMAELMVVSPDIDQIIEAYRVMDGVTNSRIDTNVPEVLERFV